MGKVKKASSNGLQKATATSSSYTFHPTRRELYEMGKSLRDKCPRHDHAVWHAPAGRPDPLALLEESSKGRIPQLIPIRYGRMMRTPFTFYRGAALNMAADLATTPTTGLRAQACGDAHLVNFGAYATPERRVIFDINDLDDGSDSESDHSCNAWCGHCAVSGVGPESWYGVAAWRRSVLADLYTGTTIVLGVCDLDYRACGFGSRARVAGDA